MAGQWRLCLVAVQTMQETTRSAGTISYVSLMRELEQVKQVRQATARIPVTERPPQGYADLRPVEMGEPCYYHASLR